MKLLLLILIVASCSTPEEATIEAGGKGRVICLRPDNGSFVYCRDGRRAMYVCKNAPKSTNEISL